MNTLFDFKRAGLLAQRHFIERFQGELMFWGISIICMMFMRNIFPAVTAFAVITCIFRTGQFFREIHSATNRINYFMIPATQIEKFVMSLLYTVIGFWLMMFVVYVIGNILGTWANNLLANIDLLSNIFGFRHQGISWAIFNSIKDGATAVHIGHSHASMGTLVGILTLQSLFILGSIYFKKNQVFKTFFALVIIGFFLGLIIAVETKYLLIDSLKALFERSEINSDLNANTLLESGKIIFDIFLYLLAPYLWFTSYIRLTEKEV